jgi:spermidine synthase
LRNSRAFIATIFFLSGAAALIYEISWVRLFSVLFGNSMHAIAVVVAIYMTGLALGSFIFGRISDRSVNALRLYGAIELGVGGSAVLVPYLLGAAEPLIASLYSAGAPALSTLTLTRGLVAAGVLVVPTTLMGATLPIVSKHVVTHLGQIGTRIGLLYGLNTLGSVVGCALAGILLIRIVGATNSTYIAACLNAVIGLVAILAPSTRASRLGAQGRNHRDSSPLDSTSTSPAPGTRFRLWFILLAFFVSGFAALSYELVWTRILGFLLQSGTSTYAFTIILTVFLAGLGIGALVYAPLSPRLGDPVAAFGSLHILIGAAALASLLALGQLSAHGFPEVSRSYWATDILKASVLMLAPTILMGISFPLGCRVVTESSATVGRNVGRAYALNLLGSVAGPLVTGFVLLPRLGSEGVLYAMVTASLVTGLFLVVLFGSTRGRILVRMIPVAAVLLLGYARTMRPNLVLQLLNTGGEPVVYFKEESSGSLVATQLKDGVHLIVGGSVGAGSTPIYQRTDELLAYIPLLLHPSPRQVAVICFGTGRTTGLFAQHPAVESVDVVEIAQGAFDAGRDLFGSFNMNVLSNPKVRPVLDDGFNFLKYSPDRYDVISIDPFTPRDPGSARLYTRDFLQFAKARLNTGGVVVMWAFPPRVRMGSFMVALKTFQAVFPNTTVWLSPVDQHALFVATPEPLVFSVADLASRLAARPPQTRYPYHVTNLVSFLSLFFLDEAAVKDLVAAEARPPFTVDRPNLEFLYMTDRSRFLDSEWRRRVASSVAPRLRNIPTDLEAALTDGLKAFQ